MIEISLVVVWAVVVSAPLLELDPAVVPQGREWLGSIQHHHFWTRARECGLCALWWGNSEGGNPALGDPVGHLLDPFIALPTLALGVVNGSKAAGAAAFALAGLAQWALARALGLGAGARLWSAWLAVVAGHLGFRVAFGPHMLLATAQCALALAALAALGRDPTRRRAALLGGAIGLVGLGGLMYPQVGLACAAPAVLFYLRRGAAATLARRLAVAGGLGALLAAPALLPFLHFLPSIAKEYDASFGGVTAPAGVAKSLVVADEDAYSDLTLGRQASVFRNANFVGWIPVGFAGFAVLWAIGGTRRRDVAFLAVAAVVPLLVSTGLPLQRLGGLVEDPETLQRIASIRFPAIIGTVAVAPILALAAIGLDRVLALPWPRWRQRRREGAQPAISRGLARAVGAAVDTRWLLLLPALHAVATARAFNTKSFGMYHVPPQVPEILEALRPDDLQWVGLPYGDVYYVGPAAERNLKQHQDVVYRSWEWAFKPPPEPFRVATTEAPPEGFTRIGEVHHVSIHQAPPGREYAAVTHPDGSRTVCSARGAGGRLDVECPSGPGGVLTVKENSASGWRAAVDGRSVELIEERWLALELPPGATSIALRYRPWDFALGVASFAVGVGVAGALCRSPFAAEAARRSPRRWQRL